MQSNDLNSSSADIDVAINDLGPLAWVLDELRKSLDSAAKALKRYVREAEAARGSDLAALDASQLRIARQQLHQAVGALEMVGLTGPALVLKAMEAAVQKFVQQPDQCNQDAANKIEHASFALTEYLEGVLADKHFSPVSLFPQYRHVQELVKADRIHPADLWPMEWRWLDPQLTVNAEPRNYDTESRTIFDLSVLQIMKGQAPLAASDLKDLSLGFAARQADPQPRIFWKIAAAYFEALEHGLLPTDLYVRRASSRILMQYASLSKGDTGVSDRLALDLLFFCSQASASSAHTPVLDAVRTVYGLARSKSVDYEAVLFGRFDPALLAQARKRIVSAKETWSALAAGDANKFKVVVDQFSLVTGSLVKLHPPSEPLAQALTRAIDATARSGQAPSIELAMEVATSVLYLEAAFDDLDPGDEQLAARTRHLAERLEAVKNGGTAQPLQPWMEDLYRRVSDKQTMGSVVGELRVSLGELEKSLDSFFRNPKDKLTLTSVPGQLAQMRGVLSVLGLDQASQAVLRMRDSVEQMLVNEIDEDRARAAGTFDQLGNNLGALSFLIDMLNYQPVLAKKLFVFDAAKGELKPLMGRAEKVVSAAPVPVAVSRAGFQDVPAVAPDAKFGGSSDAIGNRVSALATHAAVAKEPALAQAFSDAFVTAAFHNQQAAPQTPSTVATVISAAPIADTPVNQVEDADFDEEDLRDIFLEEAREVTGNGLEAVRTLRTNPSDINQLTILRRVFHTLKGSARMVGLNEFGEAAWSIEQLFNGWLAEQKPANNDLLSLSGTSLSGFSRWIEDIAANNDAAWTASAFRVSAEAMRTEGKLVELVLPLAATVSVAAVQPAVAPVAAQAASGHDSELELASDGFDFFTLNDAVAPTVLPAPSLPLPLVTLPVEPAAPIGEGVDFDSLLAIAGVQEAQILGVDYLDAELLEMQALQLQLDAGSDAKKGPLAAADSTAAELLEMQALQLQLDDFEALSMIDFTNSTVFGEPGQAVTDFELPDLQVAAPAALTELDSIPTDVDRTKVIGNLRIGIALYNVYLNEADEWSRRLLAELSEWAMERSLPVNDSTVAFAHSLAGSSATVGFNSLSEMARALEDALQLSQAHYSASVAARYADLFVSAAEDIRRLLHQFAAGFLKDADEHLLLQLRAVDFSDVETEIQSGAQAQELELDLDFDMAALQGQSVQGDLGSEHLEPAAAQAVAPLAEPLVEPPIEPHIKPQGEPQVKPQVNASSAAAVFAPPVFAAPAFAAASVVAVATLSALPAPPAHTASALSTSLDDPFTAVDGEDDDIDAVDAIDAELFPIFDEEAAELMPQLGGALRQWSARPENLGARAEVLRALHTLKGSARLAGALRLGEMAHKIESDIEFFGTDAAASQDFEPLLNRFDAMQQMLDVLRKADAVHESPVAAAAAISTVVPIAPVATTAPAPAPATPTALTTASALPDLVSLQTTTDSVAETKAATPDVALPVVARAPVGKSLVPAPQTMAMQPLRQAATASIRVRSQLLDRMVNQAGEVMITRSRLEVELSQLRGSLGDMSENLNRLRQQLRDIELQAETQMQSRLAQAKELQAGFDPLEFDRFTRVQELTRMMAESVNDVATVQRTLQRTVEATEDDLVAQARQTRELQRDLLKTRMVEFEAISDRLYRVVRLASKETGKQVKLDLLGGTIEMDRGMLDRMTPAFEHLLRNCVAHGIESPAVRSAAGKDAAGLITVELRQEGNDVSVEFRDDGAGLDLKRIREKAISSGLIKADQPLDDQQAANLIFMPGFTTAAQVTELSGRGIGMDVVRSEVNGVGGRIETATTLGQGTQFKLVLPLTTAVTQVVMVRSSSLVMGVPANVVETVRRTAAKELQQAYNTGTLDVGGEAVPFFWSGALLQASAKSAEVQVKNSSVVVFRSAAQRVALHVDEVLGNQEVVVKNLGPQLSRLPGLAGMSVLASGAVVLIYNPVALAAVYGVQARVLSADSAEPHVLETTGNYGASAAVLPVAAPQIPLVLVVDDSITVRRVTQRLLQREGYRVVLAADGLQALERLQEERPAVVLSDIEMPRMDGFDLARNIRADARLKDLPIVMITSRIAEKHREYAKELGVDHYLGKPYPEDELMSLVRRYCSSPALA